MAEPPLGARLNSFLRWFATGSRLKLGYFLNVCGLLGVVLQPQAANFPLYQLIENESFASDRPVEVMVVAQPSKMPYRYVANHMGFIEPKNLRWTLAPPVTALDAAHSRGETFLALIDIPVRFPEPAAWIRNRCTFVWSTWPRWLEPYNYLDWEDRSHWWEFYRCDGADRKPG